ncbi:DUF1353 domain-containing protein [Bosea sp. UC22_33]|uniref:DUF1353 domain-containing protein n=1 Tax=Bosea sp. UC22_33 TaxID=3350165 RepID=UPI003671C242
MKRDLAVGSILCALISGCAGGGSLVEPQGSLSGTLLIQWTAEDRFIYVPDPKRPLTYVRGERRIVPGRMYTDGGSIPRVFWGAKGFSPWAYGPAYAVHDWLFNEHRCGRDAADAPMTLAEANEILDDSISILVAQKKADANGEARRLIHWAVDNFAYKAWNGECLAAPSHLAIKAGRRQAPVTVGKIEMGS